MCCLGPWDLRSWAPLMPWDIPSWAPWGGMLQPLGLNAAAMADEDDGATHKSTIHNNDTTKVYTTAHS